MTIEHFKTLDDFLSKSDVSDIADIGGIYECGDGTKNEISSPYVSPPCVVDVYDLSLGFDICKEVLPREYSTIVCLNTFKHLVDPVRASENIVKSLKKNGRLIVSAPFCYDQHDYPIDMYRYTDTAFRVLFKDLDIEKCWYSEEPPNYKDGFPRRIMTNLIGSKR